MRNGGSTCRSFLKGLTFTAEEHEVGAGRMEYLEMVCVCVCEVVTLGGMPLCVCVCVCMTMCVTLCLSIPMCSYVCTYLCVYPGLCVSLGVL